MARWIVKAALQRCIGLLPRAHWWNEQFQMRVTHSLELSDERFISRLRHCRRHLEDFERFARGPGSSFTAFDLGTGWHAVVPVGLFCCGADHVWTCDVAPLLKGERIRKMLQRFVEYQDTGRLASHLPAAQASRVDRIRAVLADPERRAPEELLAPLQITAMTRDARETGLPARSINLVVSVACIEYVPSESLRDILAEMHRVIDPGGVMSLAIDLADEYAYFDPSISPFNFLRFSDRAWKWINNPIIPLNRLRISDYRALITGLGFEIEEEDNRLGSLEDLRRVPCAKRFQRYATEDLLVLHSWLVARAAARPRDALGSETALHC